jgi:hypothetical protein
VSVFGSTPLDPRGPQAGLAAQASSLRPHERGRPAVETGQRMKDAQEKKVAGAESDAAVRPAADEHADADSQGKKRDRRDGKRDAYEHAEPPPNNVAKPKASAKRDEPPKHFDLKA